MPHDPVTPPNSSLLQFVLGRAIITTYGCTRQQHETGYLLPPRTVPDYNYIFVRRGQVVWVIDGHEHVLTPGCLVVVPPGVPHHGFSRTARVTLGSIHVSAALPGGQNVFEMLVPARHRQVGEGTRLDRYLAMALEEWDRDDDRATQLTMPAWGRLVTLELLRHDAAHGLLRQRPLDPLVAELLDELSRRIGRLTTLEELAAWSGFTPQHLNRTFRRVLGVTPLQHLARLRMDRAATLLAEGKLTVKAISSAVGIDDPYYFSRLFKSFHGCSPTQYGAAAGSNSPS